MPKCVGRGPILSGRTCSNHARRIVCKYLCWSSVLALKRVAGALSAMWAWTWGVCDVFSLLW